MTQASDERQEAERRAKRPFKIAAGLILAAALLWAGLPAVTKVPWTSPFVKNPVH